MKKYKNIPILFFLLFLGVENNNAQQVWTLNQCIDSAMLNNKKLLIGKSEMRLSNEKEREVKANLLPKITANGDYKYYTDLPTQLMPMSVFGGPEGFYKEASFGVNHNLLGNIQLGMPIYSPELFGGIEKVKIAKEVSELQYQKSAEDVYFDITNLFYNAQIIKSQMVFIDSNLNNANKLLKNVKLLNQQLLAQKTDVAKVELQVQQLGTKRRILDSKYSQVLNGLKMQIGISQATNLAIEQISLKQEKVEYTTKPTLDLRLLDTKFSLLNSELKTLKKSRYLPTAFLYGSLGAMGYGYEKPMPMGGDFYSFYNMGFVGAKISMPIFNGTVTNKKIAQKKIELEINDLQKGLIADRNSLLSNNAKLKQSVAQETINESQLQINLAQTIYDKTILQQKEGLASITDVLLADNAINQAQQNYISATIDYLKANLELKKITGNIK